MALSNRCIVLLERTQKQVEGEEDRFVAERLAGLCDGYGIKSRAESSFWEKGDGLGQRHERGGLLR